MVFASATLHFSTDQPPEQSNGDLLGVERRFFRRELQTTEQGAEWTLIPLNQGDRIEVG